MGLLCFSIEAKPGQPTALQLRTWPELFSIRTRRSHAGVAKHHRQFPAVGHVLPLAIQKGCADSGLLDGDDAGCGVAAYTIYVSKMVGLSKPGLVATTRTSALRRESGCDL